MTLSSLSRPILRCIALALWLIAPLAQAHTPFGEDGFSPVVDDSTRAIPPTTASAVSIAFRPPGVKSAKASPMVSPCEGGVLCDGCTECCAQANGGHCSVCGHGVAGPRDFVRYATSNADLRSVALSLFTQHTALPDPRPPRV